MRSSDIVSHLAFFLPRLVDDFTNQFTISSITRSGTTATATTDNPHGLVIGDQVSITGAQAPIAITSINRVDTTATLITTADHDLTENAGFNVQITDATEPEFNGTFPLISVPNRRTITFKVDNSGPLTATGAPLLINGANPFQTYNGLKEVTAVPDASSFEYTVLSTIYPTAYGSPIAKTSPRITASIDIERIIEAYTAQNIGQAWAFVVMGNAVSDKNRAIQTDSTDNLQRGNFFNQRLIQSVTLYVILPTSNELSGRQARDRCEELLKPICQCLLLVKFPSLVENTNNPLMITGHGLERYSKAFYAHQYSFESTLQLGQSDIFIPDDDVAFRDIHLTMQLDVGSETFDTFIDLDSEPIP